MADPLLPSRGHQNSLILRGVTGSVEPHISVQSELMFVYVFFLRGRITQHLRRHLDDPNGRACRSLHVSTVHPEESFPMFTSPHALRSSVPHVPTERARKTSSSCSAVARCLASYFSGGGARLRVETSISDLQMDREGEICRAPSFHPPSDNLISCQWFCRCFVDDSSPPSWVNPLLGKMCFSGPSSGTANPSGEEVAALKA